VPSPSYPPSSAGNAVGASAVGRSQSPRPRPRESHTGPFTNRGSAPASVFVRRIDGSSEEVQADAEARLLESFYGADEAVRPSGKLSRLTSKWPVLRHHDP